MQPLHVAVPCVRYDDFLRLTLPRTLAVLRQVAVRSQVTVVTSPGDLATQRLAAELGAEVFTTAAWQIGGPLNKARALNDWLARQPLEDDRWLMVLDADVLLTDGFPIELAALDPQGLYSLRRRMCPHPEAFRALLAGERSADSFPVEQIPVHTGGLWDKVLTRNPAALAGYLQLWRPHVSAGLARLPETGTAEGYDLLFALSFPEHRRRFLDPWHVLHLGPVARNWQGRRTPRWELPLPMPGSRKPPVFLP